MSEFPIKGFLPPIALVMPSAQYTMSKTALKLAQAVLLAATATAQELRMFLLDKNEGGQHNENES